MICENCKNPDETWVEEKVITLAAMPSLDPRLMSGAKSTTYRLVCAACRSLPGETKKGAENDVNKTIVGKTDAPKRTEKRTDAKRK